VKPRKFYYEETHCFGSVYLIEWNSQTGLELQDTSPCIPFSVHALTILQPKDDNWRKLETSIKALALMPKEPEVPVCDGFEVHCHITFRNRLLKFLIINPEFSGRRMKEIAGPPMGLRYSLNPRTINPIPRRKIWVQPASGT